MESNVYKATDKDDNLWEVGLKDIRGKGKLSGYIKLNDFEFIISNFNTRQSATVWWDAFKTVIKNKGVKE